MIRSYLSTDKPKLLKLMELNVPIYFDRSEIADFDAYLDQQVEDYFVLEINQVILAGGGLNYSETRNQAILSWGMVHPDHHKQGKGTQLTQYRIKFAKSQSQVQEIIVRTSQFTYEFYQKMGFNLEKTERDFWAKGFDLYHMVMSV